MKTAKISIAISVLVVLAALAVVGYLQTQNKHTTLATPARGVSITQVLYSGVCITNSSGSCEMSHIPSLCFGSNGCSPFNSSFNYSITFGQPDRYSNPPGYIFNYTVVNGSRLVQKGFFDSNNPNLTVNDVLCIPQEGHVPSTCPISENTTFRLVNVTRFRVNGSAWVNFHGVIIGTGGYSAPVNNSNMAVEINNSNGRTFYSHTNNNTLPLNSSVAANITTSAIKVTVTYPNGTHVDNAWETMSISGRFFIPYCWAVLNQSPTPCISGSYTPPSTTTIIYNETSPFPNPIYLKGCFYSNATIGKPCFTRNFSEAYVFGCGPEATTSKGCAMPLGGLPPQYNYNVTIWFPFTNSSFPERNCAILPELWYGVTPPIRIPNAWCIRTSPYNFIISEPSNSSV